MAEIKEYEISESVVYFFLNVLLVLLYLVTYAKSSFAVEILLIAENRGVGKKNFFGM